MTEFLTNLGNWVLTWFTSGWLLALILTIFLIDLIFIVRPLGHLAVVLMTAWLSLRFVPWGKWTIFWCIIIFVGTYAIYYLLYATIGKWFAILLQRGAPAEKLHRIIGEKGHIRIVSGKILFKWDDELWPIQEDPPAFQDGETVKCTDFKDGIAFVERISPDAPANGPK